MPDPPTVMSYMELSARFPLPNGSDEAWCDLLRRLRMKGKLEERKHYKIIYLPRKSTVYNLRSIVQLLCNLSKKDPPMPTAAYLVERYCSEFLAILKG